MAKPPFSVLQALELARWSARSRRRPRITRSNKRWWWFIHHLRTHGTFCHPCYICPRYHPTRVTPPENWKRFTSKPLGSHSTSLDDWFQRGGESFSDQQLSWACKSWEYVCSRWGENWWGLLVLASKIPSRIPLDGYCDSSKVLDMKIITWWYSYSL